MITEEKLNVYSHFRGDIDGWARVGTQSQKEKISDADWFLIEELVQDIFLIQKNLVSKEFAQKIEAKLEKECESASVISAIKKIANKLQ